MMDIYNGPLYCCKITSATGVVDMIRLLFPRVLQPNRRGNSGGIIYQHFSPINKTGLIRCQI